MKVFNERFVDKPSSITDEYELIGIIGSRDLPVSPDPEKSYSKSTLAFNEDLNVVQVYVTSATEEGLQTFLKDYPNCQIQTSPMLTGNWVVLAFQGEDVPENATPLDRFFQGRSTVVKKQIINSDLDSNSDLKQ